MKRKLVNLISKAVLAVLLGTFQQSFSAAAAAPNQGLSKDALNRQQWLRLINGIKTGDLALIKSLVPAEYHPTAHYYGYRNSFLEKPHFEEKLVGLSPLNLAYAWHEIQKEKAESEHKPLNPVFKQIIDYLELSLYLKAAEAIANDDPDTLLQLINMNKLDPFKEWDVDDETISLESLIVDHRAKGITQKNNFWRTAQNLIWMRKWIDRARTDYAVPLEHRNTDLVYLAYRIPSKYKVNIKLPYSDSTLLDSAWLAYRSYLDKPHERILDYFLWTTIDPNGAAYSSAYLAIIGDDIESFKKIMAASPLDINLMNLRHKTLKDAMLEQANDSESQHRRRWRKLTLPPLLPNAASPLGSMRRAPKAIVNLKALDPDTP